VFSCKKKIVTSNTAIQKEEKSIIEIQRKLFVDSLKNALITLYGTPFRLKNGRCYFPENNPTKKPMFDSEIDLIEPIVFADLNSDGKEEAIVNLAEYAGGTGYLYTLNVFLNKDGVPIQAAKSYLGDRIDIKSIKTSFDSIFINMRDPRGAKWISGKLVIDTSYHPNCYLFRNDSLIKDTPIKSSIRTSTNEVN
jgi:hypothetical protein